MKVLSTRSVLLLLSLGGTHTRAYEDTCTQFKDIYADGTELCEKMWDGAFSVVETEQVGYTMWFFDENNNPNDATTRSLFGENGTVDDCKLQYNHKVAPSPEDESMRECHPWKQSSCCHSDTVSSVDAINEAYGAGFEWDRCGPMSQACERFFVMEACFYECEPNAGLFRKYDDDSTDPDANTWQMTGMPIKKSFCDSWYTACYNDYFCGKGNFWECEAHFHAKTKQEAEVAKQKDQFLVIGLSAAGAVAGVALLVVGYMAMKEKMGKPVFSPEPVQSAGVAT